jgi:hypothetical protein
MDVVAMLAECPSSLAVVCPQVAGRSWWASIVDTPGADVFVVESVGEALGEPFERTLRELSDRP